MDRETIKKHYDVIKIAHAIAFFNERGVQYLGVTKLMKLFFFSDKEHLEKTGKSIFNQSYSKLPMGPVPLWVYGIIRTSVSGVDDYDFENEINVFNSIISAKKVNNAFGDGFSFKFENKIDFDNRFFSVSQIRALEEVSKRFKNTTASEISDISHQTSAWKNASDNDIISFYSMVDDQEMKKFVAFREREKRSFTENFMIHKIRHEF